MEILDEEVPEGGWTMVKRKVRRTDEELQHEFWNEIGFPTPASRTWERRSSSPSPDHGKEVASSDLGMPSSSAMPATPRRALPSPPMVRAMASKPMKLGWRGPLPRPRVTPPAVLGMFLPTVLGTMEGTVCTPAVEAPVSTDRRVGGDCGVQIRTLIPDAGGPRPVGDPSHPSPWVHLSRRFAGLWCGFGTASARVPCDTAPETPAAKRSTPTL